MAVNALVRGPGRRRRRTLPSVESLEVGSGLRARFIA